MDKKRLFSEKIFRPFCEGDRHLSDQLTDLLYQKFTVESHDYGDNQVWTIVENYFTEKVIPHKMEVRKAGLGFLEQTEFLKLISLSDGYLKDDPAATFKYHLWIHDLSKFSLNEAYGYAVHDFKNPEPTLSVYRNAWHHHKINNPHHPEYWFNAERGGTVSPLPMPGIYVGEMIADWVGASRSYGTDLKEWLARNLSQFLFHPYTAHLVQTGLSVMGFKVKNKDNQLFLN
ncbi:MAG: DUF5662 family protein [Spirosomataceae bacterium]